jgi:hypothetical protein
MFFILKLVCNPVVKQGRLPRQIGDSPQWPKEEFKTVLNVRRQVSSEQIKTQGLYLTIGLSSGLDGSGNTVRTLCLTVLP